MLTSAAFCNPDSGLAALLLLGLPSATQCDIQTREGESNMHLDSVSSYLFSHLPCCVTQHEAENIFNGSHSDVNASKDGSLLDGTGTANGKILV